MHPKKCSASAKVRSASPYQRQLDYYISEIASGENIGPNTVKLR